MAWVLAPGAQPGTASLIETENARPNRTLDYELPAGFEPAHLAFAAGRMYLAAAGGRIAYYSEPPPEAGRKTDRPPRLITSLDPFYTAAREAGIAEVKVLAVVDAAGRPRSIQTTSRQPITEDVRKAMNAWRFEPGLRNGETDALPLRMEIQVPPLR